MNTKEYIESGILESYVMGQITDQERQEVECISKIYPEVKEELIRLELTMEKYAIAHQVQVKESIKEKIFSQMIFDDQSGEKEEIIEPRIISLWPKVSVAAAVLFGILSVGLFYQYNKIKQRLDLTQIENLNMATFKEKNQKLIALFKESKLVKLKGVEKSPNSMVLVLYNEDNATANLLVESLPAAPKGKQYQLWGIVNGQPIDMGTIDNQYDGKILTMKSINGKPAAFAVTLEKQGGSPTPTLEEMYVLGNV